MKLTAILNLAFILIFNQSLFSQQYLSLSDESVSRITDLVLIYQGGTHRPDWTQDDFKPYVYREDGEGKPEWLFDGFLFIEFKDNEGHEYAHGYKQQPAGKLQWRWLLERNFEKDRAIQALNLLLDSLENAGFSPARKRKVVLTLPEPIINFTEWGKLNGKDLDFSRADDRYKACQWYIDLALMYWDQMGLEHLELAGFYWVAEQSGESTGLLPEVFDYIAGKGMKFFWIPYWNAVGAGDWKQSGFDGAYQQPNHFFSTDTPDERLDEACRFAGQHGMGMEFEFDPRVNNPEFRERFYKYVEAYKTYGIWDSVAVAYYEGGIGVMKCSQSNIPEVKKVYDDLADIITDRQKKADVIYITIK
ncbi:DUF4855 domain-containing protein [Bacteroidota bacterium]